jgi:hypothetical protein
LDVIGTNVGWLFDFVNNGVSFYFEIKEPLLLVFGNLLEFKNLQFWIFNIFNFKRNSDFGSSILKTLVN